MRPRFMNRGSVPVRGVDMGDGTSFNEAPIHESGKSGGVGLSVPVVPASMRPRFMNRGSSTTVPHFGFTADALQ